MTDPVTQSVAPDEIDHLFSAYFQQELPHPWPAFHPTPTSELRQATVPFSRSRLTLAASAASLLAFAMFLTSGFQPGQTHTPVSNQRSLLNGSEADGSRLKNMMDHARQSPEKVDPKK